MKRFKFKVESETFGGDKKKWWYIKIEHDFERLYFGPYASRQVARFYNKCLKTVMNGADAAEVPSNEMEY